MSTVQSSSFNHVDGVVLTNNIIMAMITIIGLQKMICLNCFSKSTLLYEIFTVLQPSVVDFCVPTTSTPFDKVFQRISGVLF